jgi:hypothetical protein
MFVAEVRMSVKLRMTDDTASNLFLVDDGGWLSRRCR